MQVIYAPEHARHNPRYEFLDGRLVPYYESPQRAEILRAALEEAGHTLVPPRSHGLAPVLAVHSADYMRFFAHAYARWVAAGGAEEGVLPSSFAVRRFGRHSPDALAEPGYYCFDLSGVIVAETYAAALGAADVALTGADLLIEGQRGAYALCRPPGHHAGYDIFGGYCYLNNAAIAAQYLLEKTNDQRPTTNDVAALQAVRPSSLVVDRPTVAILDIDFHHGNGTQDLFYARDDVLFVSIHADPARHYPYFIGYADERGVDAGVGFTINYPLERGINDERYLAVLDQALEAVARFGPRWLVVSVGFDTYAEDPVARNDFALTQAVYGTIGARIAALGLPTLHVQEGGYAVATLGENAARYLGGFEEGMKDEG